MVASMSMPSSSSSFRRSPAIIFFLGIFLLVAMVFRSNTKLADHDHHYRHDNVVRVTTGLVRQAQHEYAKLSASSSVFKYPSIKFSSPSPSSSANNASLSSLKELVKEAMDRGLVVIVNASEGDAARLFADNAHGARREWDINGALDGPTGEILAEVIQELRNMEELQQELAELKAKIKRSNFNDEGKGGTNNKCFVLSQCVDVPLGSCGRRMPRAPNLSGNRPNKAQKTKSFCEGMVWKRIA